MKLGLYVHVPFCLQKCTYCDFSTTSWKGNSEALKYMELVTQELRWAVQHFPARELHSIYFGGGTPSLLPPSAIFKFREDLKDAGLSLQLLSEVTLEINPGTVTEEILRIWIDAGVNRFSVGAQTFQENLLKPLGREHSVADTLETLSFLSRHSLNFTLDVLYGLPGQRLPDLLADLDIVKSFRPPHVSTYNLTIPDRHPLQPGRAADDEQVDMYFAITEELEHIGVKPYEISNLAKEGWESKHNRIYWEDGSYWGLGLSSHSYNPSRGPWGTRFWNPHSFAAYSKWVGTLYPSLSFESAYPESRREDLTKGQSIIDFVHTSLRQVKGMSEEAFEKKYSPLSMNPLRDHFASLAEDGLIQTSEKNFALTPRGRMLLNTVLQRLFAHG
jgi:oxygen-independent coproporphyrinogen-3 oxidase